MGPHYGRVLQAYYDDGYLVLRKSRLYEFSVSGMAPFDLFVRYAACKPM